MADITVDVGVAVGFLLCFIVFSVKKSDEVIMQGVSAHTSSTSMYRNLW